MINLIFHTEFASTDMNLLPISQCLPNLCSIFFFEKKIKKNKQKKRKKNRKLHLTGKICLITPLIRQENFEKLSRDTILKKQIRRCEIEYHKRFDLFLLK